MPAHLLKPHPAVRAVRKALRAQRRIAGLQILLGETESPIRVSPSRSRRLLLVLDALANGLVARGHEVTLSQRFVEGRLRYSVQAIVKGRPIELSVVERTRRVDRASSTKTSDNLPAEAACRSCHQIDRARPDKAVPAGAAAARSVRYWTGS